MIYKISYSNPHQHYIDIEFIADKIQSDTTVIQLPAWRPGRYELGNFAKNVQKWEAYDAQGKRLNAEKISKDSWKVDTRSVNTLHIRYNYFAAELNAGSTYLDETQLYINPVNCCVYIPERINESCKLQLDLPAGYNVAIGVESKDGDYFFKDFHELADNPFIASSSLQHNLFVCEGREFHLWFQGECHPDWSKLNNDFIKFCDHTLATMKKAPFERYHFLFQILPQRFYHGVEHTTSTVIALGPGYNLMKGDLYANLLGVSCHELFHAWNIKTIRPADMQPYDYSRENYSRLGYVCEGVTTYYGDYLLLRSGVFTVDEYLKTFAERLQKHFDNGGRFNMSVADSSFDTWLDGYVAGVPNRKTSIYDEGCLIAFITDVFIRKNSAGKHCLDDVMRYLNDEFALKGKGYTASDYKGIVEHFANSDFGNIYNNLINGTADYEPFLKEAMAFVGCELQKLPSSKLSEHGLGLKVQDVGSVCKVVAVYPGSVADKAGIAVQEEIMAVNGIQVRAEGAVTNFNEWCNYFQGQELKLTVATNSISRVVEVKPEERKYYLQVSMKKSETAGEEERKNFEKWSGQKF
jgi:predicted metalloprotease with PDZ domain